MIEKIMEWWAEYILLPIVYIGMLIAPFVFIGFVITIIVILLGH